MNFRLLRSSVASILVATASGLSAAQEVCVDLAKVIVFNQSRSFSLDEQRAISKADLCAEQYQKDGRARSAQIEASYKFFSGGVSGSENQIREEQNKQCEAKFGDYWSRTIRSSDARTASVDSLAVLNECVRMNSKGMTPRVTLAADGSDFTLSLDWNPSAPVDLRIDHVGPRDFKNIKCSAQVGPTFKPILSSKDIKTTVPTGSSFVLSCERLSTSRKVDGEDFTCYRETLVSVATSGPSATLKIPQSCTPSMPGRRAEVIEQRLRDSDASVKYLSDKLSQAEQSFQVRLQANTAGIRVPTNAMAASGGDCQQNQLGCVAAAGRKCIENGFSGGTPQEWNANEHVLLCVGKK